jgi:hypothetical protein
LASQLLLQGGNTLKKAFLILWKVNVGGSRNQKDLPILVAR